MAITIVQAPKSALGFGGTTQALSFNATPTVGNTLIVAGGGRGGTGAISSVTDNQAGNTWAAAANGSNTQACAGIFYCGSVVGATGTFTVTINYSPSPSNSPIFIMEVSGLLGTVDQNGVGGDAGSAQTAGTVTAGGVNANANALVVAVICPGAFNTILSLTDPANTGYTSMGLFDPANNASAEASYKIVSGTETSSASWTFASTQWRGAIATFGGAGTVVVPLMGQICL